LRDLPVGATNDTFLGRDITQAFLSDGKSIDLAVVFAAKRANERSINSFNNPRVWKGHVFEEKFLHYLKHSAMQYPERIPRNHRAENNVIAHAQEWLAAVKENKPEMCYSRFDIAARLTEIVLESDRLTMVLDLSRQSISARELASLIRLFSTPPVRESACRS
jgi:hypothetical protein